MIDKLDIDRLASQDIYSMAMFLLFKFKDVPQFEVMSELPYILEKDELLTFLKYYGGKTIKVPTTDEFLTFLRLMLLYQYHMVEGKSFEESKELSGYTEANQHTYNKLRKMQKLLDVYKVKRNSKYE